MKSPLRRTLFVAFVFGLGGMAVAALAEGGQAGAGCGGGSCAVSAAPAAGDPVASGGGACNAATTSAEVESAVVLNAAEGKEPVADGMKMKMPMCAACKGAGGMCEKCKAAHMQKGGMKLDELKKSIDAAKAALEAGDSKTALAELVKAQALAASMQEMHKKMCAAPAAGDGKAVNSKCPIMGSKIDPANVPANLTRVFKGQTVGFCCGGCPGAWDKLSDDEKQAKLDAAMKAQ